MTEPTKRPRAGTPSPGGEGDPDRHAVRPRHENQEDTIDRRDDESRRRNPRPAPTDNPEQFEEFAGTERAPSESEEDSGRDGADRGA